MGGAASHPAGRPFLTVGELLGRWLCAHHDWRPATWIGARSNAKAFCADPLGGAPGLTLKPEHVRAAMAAWSAAGRLGGRRLWALPRAALRHRLGARRAHHRRQPAAGMRGPQRPGTRLHLAPKRCSVCSRPPTRWWPPVAPRDAERRTRPNRSDCWSASRRIRGATWRLVALRFDDLQWQSAQLRAWRLGRRARAHQDRAARRLTLGRGRPSCGDGAPMVGRGGSQTAPLSVPGSSPPRPHTTSGSAPAPSGTGSPGSPEPPRSAAAPHRLRHFSCYLPRRAGRVAAGPAAPRARPSTTLRNYAHAMPLEDGSVADDIDQMLGTPAHSSERDRSTDTS